MAAFPTPVAAIIPAPRVGSHSPSTLMLMLKWRTAFALSVAAAIAVLASGGAVAATSDAASTKAVQTHDTSRALVILNGDPLSTYVRTKPAKGKKIDFTSNTTKSYRAQLSALRNEY
jgi:hypothetical protein